MNKINKVKQITKLIENVKKQIKIALKKSDIWNKIK